MIVPARSRLQPWGLELGPEIAVADDGFQSVARARRSRRSARRTCGGRSTPTTAEFDVVAPAGQGSTPTPAQTRGLGIVFLNAGPRPRPDPVLQRRPSLLARPFRRPPARLRSRACCSPMPSSRASSSRSAAPTIFGWNGTTVIQGGAGSVAGDDIVQAEPGPKLQATAGVPISPVLDTFTENDATAYVAAAIDWGDGTRTAGTIVPASGGGVRRDRQPCLRAGRRATPRSSPWTTSSDESSRPRDTLIQVAPRASSLSVTCSPSPVAVTASTTCTATVADAGAGGPITPTGTVELSSPTAGASFADDSGCMLGATETPGRGDLRGSIHAHPASSRAGPDRRVLRRRRRARRRAQTARSSGFARSGAR